MAGTRFYTLHNGHNAVATMEISANQDAGPSNNMAFVFNEFDSMMHGRLKYLCLSPETTPNPKGFKHDI